MSKLLEASAVGRNSGVLPVASEVGHGSFVTTAFPWIFVRAACGAPHTGANASSTDETATRKRTVAANRSDVNTVLIDHVAA